MSQCKPLRDQYNSQYFICARLILYKPYLLEWHSHSFRSVPSTSINTRALEFGVSMLFYRRLSSRVLFQYLYVSVSVSALFSFVICCWLFLLILFVFFYSLVRWFVGSFFRSVWSIFRIIISNALYWSSITNYTYSMFMYWIQYAPEWIELVKCSHGSFFFSFPSMFLIFFNNALGKYKYGIQCWTNIDNNFFILSILFRY